MPCKKEQPDRTLSAARRLLLVATQCYDTLGDEVRIVEDQLAGLHIPHWNEDGSRNKDDELKSGAAFCSFARTNLSDAIWWLRRLLEAHDA